MKDVDEIVCTPKKPVAYERAMNWFYRGICAMILAGFFGFIAALVWEWIEGCVAPTKVTLAAGSVGFVVGLILTRVVERWEEERWHWILTPSELIGGRDGQWRRSLSSINKIVPGVPARRGTVENTIIQICQPELYQLQALDRSITLLLKFSDGLMLPFNVHRCANGTRLMNELLARCQDVVDLSYEYTQRERRLLRFPSWNKPIQPRVKSEPAGGER